MMKHKSSAQTLRSNKPHKLKQSSTMSSRTLKEQGRSSNRKKSSLSKNRSIPIIDSKQAQCINFLSTKCVHKSQANNQAFQVMQYSTQTQSQLINSIQDRNNSGSKVSLHSKIPQIQKEALNLNKEEIRRALKSRSHQKCSGSLNDIFKKTKHFFQQFRKKEEAWKKQKKSLLKQIEKFKNKSHRKNTSSNVCAKKST